MWFQFVLVVLASYRLTRLVTLDDFPPLSASRRWLGQRWGWDVENLDRVRYPDGVKWFEAVLCSWCIGFWISAALVGSLAQVRDVPLPVLQVLACSTVVGFLGARDG